MLNCLLYTLKESLYSVRYCDAPARLNMMYKMIALIDESTVHKFKRFSFEQIYFKELYMFDSALGYSALVNCQLNNL